MNIQQDRRAAGARADRGAIFAPSLAPSRQPTQWTRRGLALLLGAMACTTLAQAQTPAAGQAPWPQRPVRWVVPFGAGGPSDVVARLMALKLGERWGQSVVVDNKPGANTIIGATDVARAAPDGYTLFQPLNSTFSINKFAYGKLPYDLDRNFQPIALLATLPGVFVSNDTLPIKSIADLVRQARENPGKVTVGGATVGLQIGIEMFARDAQISLQYVPYKSGVEVTRALLAGEINVGFDPVVANAPYIKQGKLHALASNGPTRTAALPEMPTLAELGYRNSEAVILHPLLAPAGTPPEIVTRIQNDVRVVLEQPDVVERFRALGFEPTWKTAAEVREALHADAARMGPIIKSLGIKLD